MNGKRMIKGFQNQKIANKSENWLIFELVTIKVKVLLQDSIFYVPPSRIAR